MIIDSVLNTDEDGVLNETIKDLTSSYEGTVESIEVLRGTALVSVGDKVNVGDALIGAYMLGKTENVYPTYVVGKVTLLIKETFEYNFESVDDNIVKMAETTAKFHSTGEVVSVSSTVNNNNVKVEVIVRKIVNGS